MIEKTFTEEQIQALRSGNGKITLNGRRYRLGRMSYGDYFLEPVSWKGGETEGHSPETIWLEKKLARNQYGRNQVTYGTMMTIKELERRVKRLKEVS